MHELLEMMEKLIKVQISVILYTFIIFILLSYKKVNVLFKI